MWIPINQMIRICSTVDIFVYEVKAMIFQDIEFDPYLFILRIKLID